MTQRSIPAVFMRGGSSKGVFFHARDLPADRAAQEAIFLAVIGSPDPYGRQLDGMGGGISSLSKAVIIGPSTHPEADVDYTFAQVAVDRPVVDWGSNCGNLSGAVGPFAVDEGLVEAPHDGEALVRIHQTNTRKIMHARFPMRDGRAEVAGDLAIAGVAGTGARVRIDILNPGGTRTSGLLPTGKVMETLDGIRASLVDAANPTVFVDAEALGCDGTESPEAIEAKPGLMARLDMLRGAAAVAMGMVATPEEAGLAVPKIAMVAPPRDFTSLDGTTIAAEHFDIATRVLSMERAHRATPLTSAMCLGVAARIPGTLPNLLARAVAGEEVRVGNPSGVLSVGGVLTRRGEVWHADGAIVFRTARRLMDGRVYYLPR
ncbi:MAG: PrpF family protein [Rhodospirillales bacterium]|nr:PrpF family protein [Rhodospirillales bacterium]